jgi:hypothetical protein
MFGISILAVFLLCIIVFCCRGLCVECQRRSHQGALLNTDGGRTYGTMNRSANGLPDEILAEIPLVRFDETNYRPDPLEEADIPAASGEIPLSQEGPSCRICFEEFAASDMVRVLPCNHIFHDPCIDEWFGLRRTCPLCVRNVADLVRAQCQQVNG